MVEIKGVNFEVTITKKRIRNIYLRVVGNKIEATCPYYVAQYEVYNFINTKRNWIYRTYLYNEYKKQNSLMYRGGDNFYIFNMEYKLVRSIGRKKINIDNDSIYFAYKDESEESIKALYKYLDNRLLIKAQEYLDKYSGLLKDYGYELEPELNARCMTSKWGCCFTKKNKITISSYLIHYPIECLEYIILHEIVHFIVPNHSKRFYEIIFNKMPNYKEISAKLKY